MMSSAGMLLSEFKRTNSANRTLSRVLMPRRPDSGGSMRLAERCTERARATTSHKPRRHSNQSTLPTRRRSPRVPCVHHTLAAWTFAHRTTQRALEHGLQEPGHRSTLWHPAGCGTRQQRSRPVLGLQHQSCPATGAPASRYVSTVKPFEMSTRLRARRNRVLFRYWSWECGRAYDSG
jgi:hypothetical protein